MKLRLLVACAGLVLAAPAHALAGPPEVSARAYVVTNASTGEVLAQRAPHARVPIASITKLMTVLVTLEHARPTDVVTVDADAAAVGESSVNLRAGEKLSVDDLLKAALIQSANDAADALADHVGRGDTARFVAMMNAEARTLGLHDTHFVRPDGLDAPGHVSSASDVTRLAEVVMHRPLVRKIVRESTDTIAGGRRVHTWNDLLGSFPGVIGVKTGHTSAAGWCQVGAATGPGKTIYVTVLGSPSRSQRNADLAALLSWGLSRYHVVSAVAPARAYASVRVGYGRSAVQLVAARPLRAAVRVDRRLVVRVVAPGAAELPLRRGERLGSVSVWSGRRLLGTRPLVAARAVPRPGALGRVGFYAKRTLSHLGDFFA